MSSKRYTLLGWVVWKVGSRVARRKLSQNRSKLLTAAGAIALVVLAGIALTSHDDDE